MLSRLTLQQKDALIELSSVLRSNDIPFVVIGGLAAISWGVDRPLADIDIQVSKKDILKITKLFSENIDTDFRHYQNDTWDIYQTIIRLYGITIDICQVEDFYIKSGEEKYIVPDSLDDYVIKNIDNIELPVIPLARLIKYKKTIARPIDLKDLEELTNSPY